MSSLKKLNKKGMIYLKSELTKMNIKSYPSYANFILVEFKSNARLIYEELLKEGVITRPLENYGLETIWRLRNETFRRTQRLLISFYYFLTT